MGMLKKSAVADKLCDQEIIRALFFLCIFTEPLQTFAIVVLE